MTKKAKNSSSFFEAIQELKKRENKFLIIPLNENSRLQSLLAVWEFLSFQIHKAPLWDRTLPLEEAGADLLRDYVWSGVEIDYSQIRELLGPTFPVKQTMKMAINLRAGFPDGTLAIAANAIVSSKANRLVKQFQKVADEPKATERGR